MRPVARATGTHPVLTNDLRAPGPATALGRSRLWGDTAAVEHPVPTVKELVMTQRPDGRAHPGTRLWEPSH